MRTIILAPYAGFDEWRDHARRCLQESIAPHHIIWQTSGAPEDLFAGPQPSQPRHVVPVTINKNFIELARMAACHASPGRFALLYRIAWRLSHENKNLLHHKTDSDILTLHAYVKAVRRDAYKIKAFLRFRETRDEGKEHFIAWYEPEHYSLELSLPFFQTRFKNMNWSILTPYRAAHWDGENMVLQDTPDPSLAPKDDEIERYWLKYYATTFNPARPKKTAMLSQMPKKYWKNMPETVLIPDLLRSAETRTRKMIRDSRSD